MFSRNTDKSKMKDPSTVRARIYVGNLETSVTQQDLQDKFSVYGSIFGICLQRQFGFIQFENEQSATDAINKEHDTMFKGKKLNVRAAIAGQGGKGNSKNLLGVGTDGTEPVENLNSGANFESTRRNHGVGAGRRGGRGGMNIGRGGGALGGGGGAPFRDRSPLNRDNYGTGNREDNNQAPFSTGRDSFQTPAPSGPSPRSSADRNDCEIIVVAKSLTEYAEYIEHRLKTLGLTVDLLFPNEDVPIGRVLANISSRGCLYAILVTPQNEEHRSLTLNILHGLPQEHRNMPVDDAVALISRNFEAYMRGEKGIPGTVNIGSLSDRHPEAVQVLLNLLAENRQLTVLQYDRIIKYLQDKRELQLKHELGDAADEITPTVGASKQAAELHNRILSILNSSNNKGTHSSNASISSTISQLLPGLGVSKPMTTSTPSQLLSAPSSQTPLLNDPSVQKALDSLLQGDLLKNIVNKPSGDNFGTSYSSNVRRF